MWAEKLPSGKYRFCERFINPKTGKIERKSVTLDKNTASTRKLASEILRQKMDAPSAPVTFGALCDMYLSAQKAEIKASTLGRNKVP